MPRSKRDRGRPLKNKYPPRIDASPEEIAEAFFSFPANRPVKSKDSYRCADCGAEVNYPDTLYNDGRCEKCHKAVPAA